MNENKPVYSLLEAEAMLCLWEHWAEMRVNQDREAVECFPGAFNSWGTVNMRLIICPIVARWALQVYEHLEPVRDDLDGYSYDWDIIPAIAAHVDWTSYKPRLPGPKATAGAVYREFMSRHIDYILAEAGA
jgi:hypothetical protein